MKKIIFIAAILLIITACRSQKDGMLAPVVLTNNDSTSVTPEVKLIPADSSWFYAYLECDSNNKVIMSKVINGSTTGLQNSTSFDNGKLVIKTVKPADSIQYFTIRITKLRSVPVPTPYPVEKQLSKWQSCRMMLGDIFMGICGIALLYLIFVLYKKFSFK